MDLLEQEELCLLQVKDLGQKALSNLIANLHLLENGFAIKPEVPPIEKPIVICGFGPSLKEGIRFLKKTRGSYYLLASASASLFLEEEGIIPDALALIDGAVSASCLGAVAKEKLPVFTTLSSSQEVLAACKGAKIFIDFVDLVDLPSACYEKTFGRVACIEKGWTVADFSVALANLLGFDPLYLVGVDLCYEKGKKYPHDLLESPQEEDMFSQRDWKFSAAWLGLFSYERGLNIFRVNPSSARVHIPPLSWEEFLQRPQKKIGESFENLIRPHLIAANKDCLLPFLREAFRISWDKVQKLLEAFKQNVSYYPDILLMEHDLQTDWYTEKALEPLWRSWSKIVAKDLDEASLEYSFNKTLFFASVLKKHEPLIQGRT